MDEPVASRPLMPGYGIADASAGGGLIPWTAAVQALTASANYWLATVSADGAPHLMPVWGIWHDGALWFSSGGRSRKIRNLRRQPRCTLSTEDAQNPVVLSGTASVSTDPIAIATFVEVANAKYGEVYTVEFLDPAVNATVRVVPEWAFALRHDDFTGSPTRWLFPGGTRGTGGAGGTGG